MEAIRSEIKEQVRLQELAQCPALSKLILDDNQGGAEGAGIAGVLPPCQALSYMNLLDY